MKTKVKLNGKNQYNDWNDGDTGYIDGYVRGGDERPYAVVILDKDKTAVLSAIYHLQAIGFLKINE
jgi:hypothetical protein